MGIIVLKMDKMDKKNFTVEFYLKRLQIWGRETVPFTALSSFEDGSVTAYMILL